MENVIEQLFSLSTLVLCLMIWVLVWIQRKVVEYFWKNAKASKLWNELLLPLGPIGTGAIIGAAVSQYPYPEDFQSFWARIFFCVVCGLMSAHVYRIVKKFIKRKDDEAGSGDAPDLLG